MKKHLSISLNIVLLFVFTIASHTAIWACDKSKAHKDIQHVSAKCQKACCQKKNTGTTTHCQSTCCKKHGTDTQKQKKGCCGHGDCTCSVSTTVVAVLPNLLFIDFQKPPALIFKKDYFYKQVVLQSSIADIWQPPLTALSI